MYFYSERPKTLAERNYQDDVSLEIKKRRLAEVIKLQHKHQLDYNTKAIGRVYEVLIERISKKSDEMFSGRNTYNSTIVFPREDYNIGEYVNVLVEECTTLTLKGRIVKA